MLNSYDGTLIFKSNYHEKEVKDLNIKSVFLKNILTGWLCIALEKNKYLYKNNLSGIIHL